MATIASLLIDLGMNVARLQKDMDHARRIIDGGVRDTKRTMTSLKSTMEGLVIGSGIAMLGRAMLKNAGEAEQAAARMTAVIRATGGAAGVARGEIDELADSMAKSTQFDDEGIRNAASNLMKFGNIHGNVFREALRRSADLAAFMGTDVPEAAQMVGKSLQSPTEGLMAMEKQFGKLTDAERKHIDTLVEQNNAVGAQQAVLELWQKKIGGAAEIMNTGLVASQNAARKSWNELLEDFGKMDATGGLVEKRLRAISEILDHIRETSKHDPNRERIDRMADLSGQIENLQRVANDPRQLARSGTTRDRVQQSINELRAEHRRLNAIGFEQGALTAAQRAQAEFEGSQEIGQTKVTLGGKNDDAAAKAAAEKRVREAEGIAKRIVDAEEQAAQDAYEAWDYWQKQQQALAAQALKDRQQMWTQAFEEIDREQEAAIDSAAEQQRILQDELEKSGEFARDLGMTFSSGFEDAIVKGEGFREILQGIEQDIARIIIRKKITEPFAAAIGGFDFASLFGGGGDAGPGPAAFAASSESFAEAWHSQDYIGYADGGRPHVGRPSIVGERGPEVFIPDTSGTIVPNHALGGDTTVVNHIYPSAGMDEQRLAALVSAKVAEAQAKQYRSARYGGAWSPDALSR